MLRPTEEELDDLAFFRRVQQALPWYYEYMIRAARIALETVKDRQRGQDLESR